MILALTSDIITRLNIYDAADSILGAKAVAGAKGSAKYSSGAELCPAVRAEVNPDALNKLGLGL